MAIEVSTDLITWPQSYIVPDGAQTQAIGVTVVKNTSAGYDTVILTTLAGPDGKKFARLMVTP